MTDKSTFTAQEWRALRDAPHMVAVAVSAATASGVTGTLHEAVSASTALMEGVKSESALLRSLITREELLAAQESLRENVKDAHADRGKLEFQDLMLGEVREAVGVLDRRAKPEEAEAYRAFLLYVANSVAEAAREGGFIGIGGKRVSDEEQRLLERLRGVVRKV
ncbi:MAG TPA: hypothetical protein VIC59_02510 [Gemmatimonadota bacterium]|jgi:hypothetical protein